MNAKLEMTFDLDCSDDQEKYLKVAKIFSEEDDDDEMGCPQDAINEFNSDLQELIDEAKEGTSTYKTLEKVQELLQEKCSVNNVTIE